MGEERWGGAVGERESVYREGIEGIERIEREGEEDIPIQGLLKK